MCQSQRHWSQLSLGFGSSHFVDTREETAAVEILPFVSDVRNDQSQSKNDLSLPVP